MNRRRALVTLAGAALLLQGMPALAGESMQVKTLQLDLSPDDGAVLLSAQFAVDLSAALKDAVSRGLPLHFITEFEIYRPRLFWFNKKAASGHMEWRLSYYALTRQYRLNSASGSESYATLDEAITQMTALRGWPVTTIDRLDAGEEYIVRVRMRLDTAQLPKPFQITALTDSDWNPQSEWKGLSFVVPTQPTPAP